MTTTSLPDWLTPASQMPWPVATPFRMRPNLEKLDADAPALLLRDGLADVYQRERERVISGHRGRAMVGMASEQTLAAIQGFAQTQIAATQGSPPSPLEGDATRVSPAGSGGEGEAGSSSQGSSPIRPHPLPSPLPSRERGPSPMQEDFVILKLENETLRTEYLSVCFPSRWDPREKLGLDFAAIHAPVADNQTLMAAGPSIMTMAFMKQPMLRHVWLIVPSASLDQHPDKNEAWWTEALRDMSPLLTNLYFRVERQTTWPLPQFERAVFFIRVMMSPLEDVLANAPGRPAELAESLRSMTPEVVAYRGMTEAMPRLLAELDHFE